MLDVEEYAREKHLMSETNLASQELLIGGDFSALWSAAKLFIEGKSIYQQSEFFPLYDSIAAGYIGPGPIYYPPWLLALVWPFGFASWEASLYVWLCLNFALLFSLPFLVAKLLYARSPLRSELFLIPLLLPCLYALKLGQISLLLLFFALASLVYLKARRTFFAGLLLSIVISPRL